MSEGDEESAPASQSEMQQIEGAQVPAYTEFNPYTAINTPDYRNDEAKRVQQRNRLSAHLPEVVPADAYDGKEVRSDSEGSKEVVGSPEKEVVRSESTGKEVVHLEHLPEPYDENGGKEAVYGPQDQKAQTWKDRLNRRIYGVRLQWIILGLSVLVLLIIILGAGLGAGLHHGTSNKKTDAQSGALSGTKISVVTQSLPATDGQAPGEDSLVMYFQHETGSIRWMWLADNGTWLGGDTTSVIAVNAKNNTPISAVSYTEAGWNVWRVYYIDNTNLLQEVWNSNASQGWALGPLGQMNLSPMNSDQVGMVACWYGPTKGDEYSPGHSVSGNADDLLIRMVYAQDATTFQQISYRGDTQVWTTEQSFSNLNGAATPACYNEAPGTVDYMMFVDMDDSVNVYWQDSNSSIKNTTTHPIKTWTNCKFPNFTIYGNDWNLEDMKLTSKCTASISIPNVDSSTTLAYTGNLYAQDTTTNMIKGYNITFAAENTTLESGSDFTIQNSSALPGTGVGIIAQPESSGSYDVFVFFQTSGSDISKYSRGIEGGAWSIEAIGVPSS